MPYISIEGSDRIATKEPALVVDDETEISFDCGWGYIYMWEASPSNEDWGTEKWGSVVVNTPSGGNNDIVMAAGLAMLAQKQGELKIDELEEVIIPSSKPKIKYVDIEEGEEL